MRETMQGIQSILDPYDCILSDPLDPANVRLQPSSLRSQFECTSLVIREAPVTLPLLLGLKADGQLTCRFLEELTPRAATDPSRTGNLKQIREALHGFQPRELISRPVVLPASPGPEDAADDEPVEEMDVDEEDGVPELQEGDEQVPFSFQRIRTRDFWKSECLSSSSSVPRGICANHALFLIGLLQTDSNGLPLVSLVSFRSFLNDTEQLPSTGVFTLCVHTNQMEALVDEKPLGTNYSPCLVRLPRKVEKTAKML